MKYYVIDIETDKILDGCNSRIAAEMKAEEISRREHIETAVTKEQL